MRQHELEEQWVNGNRMDVINYFLERLAEEPKKCILEMLMFLGGLPDQEETAFRLMWRRVAL